MCNRVNDIDKVKQNYLFFFESWIIEKFLVILIIVGKEKVYVKSEPKSSKFVYISVDNVKINVNVTYISLLNLIFYNS